MPRRNYYRYIIGILISLSFVLFAKNSTYNKGQVFQMGKRALPEKARVVRVVDGDTIVLENNFRVRYIGINTPETKHPKKGVEYFGREASEFNKDLVLNKEVILEYDIQRFDKYGRILAYVYVGDVFINAKLVREGYAQVFTVPPNVKYADLFLELQGEARAKKKGLWGLTK